MLGVRRKPCSFGGIYIISVDLNLQSPKRGDKKVDFQIVVDR